MPPLRERIFKCYPVAQPPDVRSNRHEGPWWDWYNGYLRSAIWVEVRRRVIAAAHGDCQCCRAAAATTAHHLTYDRVGHERWDDLQAVCQKCHEEIHGR